MTDQDPRTLATDSLLANVDLYTDWLAAQCMGHGNVQLGYVWSDPYALELRCANASVPELVALTRYPSKAAQWAAQCELTKRCDAEHIERVMAEMAAGETR